MPNLPTNYYLELDEIVNYFMQATHLLMPITNWVMVFFGKPKASAMACQQLIPGLIGDNTLRSMEVLRAIKKLKQRVLILLLHDLKHS